VADSELPYGQFADFLDHIERSTDDLHVIVISGEIRREFEKPRMLLNPSRPQTMEEDFLSVCDLAYSSESLPDY
jgi:hypothetical protein